MNYFVERGEIFADVDTNGRVPCATSHIPSSARLVAAEGRSGSECDVWSLDEPLESEGLARKLSGTLETPASSCARNNRSSSC